VQSQDDVRAGQRTAVWSTKIMLLARVMATSVSQALRADTGSVMSQTLGQRSSGRGVTSRHWNTHLDGGEVGRTGLGGSIAAGER
jgi:hypothetical protein